MAPRVSARGFRAAGTEAVGSSSPNAMRTTVEVALGFLKVARPEFSSRGAAAAAHVPRTDRADLRGVGGRNDAVVLPAAKTRSTATRDGDAMFTSETADMSTIGWTPWTRFASIGSRARCVNHAATAVALKSPRTNTVAASYPVSFADIFPAAARRTHTLERRVMHGAIARVAGPTPSPLAARSRASNRRRSPRAAPSRAKDASRDAEDISKAMADARACEESGLSPGAGLADADAQAEAAFADMINTTVDVTGEALDSEELSQLSRGGKMDEESKAKKSGGILGDVRDLFGALSKGAHIVKQKGGRV